MIKQSQIIAEYKKSKENRKKDLELFSVLPLLKELNIPKEDIFKDRERPDIVILYNGKKIGIEETKYCSDNKILKGDPLLHQLLTECMQILEEHKKTHTSIYVILNKHIYSKRINKEKFINEFTSHLFCQCQNPEYINKIFSTENEENSVKLIFTIDTSYEIDCNIIKTIIEKDQKLVEYKKLTENQDIKEYWLVIYICNKFESYEKLVLPPFQSEYNRIYITSMHEPVLRIK